MQSGQRGKQELKYLITIIWMSISIVSSDAQIYINEFQAGNVDTKMDWTSNYRAWVEFYNPGNEDFSLRYYWLSNDLSNPYQHQMGGLTVPAHGYAMTWVNEDKYDPCCILKIFMDGGTLGLFNPSGELVDSVSFKVQYPVISYGRYPDGGSDWSYFGKPTPIRTNTGPAFPTPEFPEELIFSHEAGMYQGNQVLEIQTLSGTGTIHYTTDGSMPTESSPVYSAPILLTETSVIRAFLQQDGKLPGPVITKTFILNDSSSLPVVSIVTDNKHFYDDRYGFFVVGTNGILGRCATEPVNWNQDWERPANFEYFTPDGTEVINQMAGLRIFGGCSRMLCYKSIAVIARKKYGDNSLSYPFFRSKEVDSFKSIVLRNSGNDAFESMMRDGFMQSLLEPYLDMDLQGYQPANIFLNGEYFGILNVREKINEHYPASNYDMNSEEVDMLEREYYNNPISGSGEHYLNVLDFIGSNSLSDPANYDYIKTQVDVEEYMNYFLSNIYFANEDWPHNNCKYWRPAVEGGKWRWILYDTDFGWGLFPRSGNTLNYITTDAEGADLFNALLENSVFRNEFIQRMATLINTAFQPDTVTQVFDSLVAQLDREIYRHMDRWSFPKEDEYLYQTREKMPEFTRNHPALVRQQFRDKFSISGMFDLSLGVNNPALGHIRVSEINVPDGYHGSYFNDIPIHVEAIPASGYSFSHWEGDSQSAERSIYYSASSNSSLRAVFVTDTPLHNIRINEISAKNTTGPVDEYGQMEDWIEIYNGNDYDVDLAGLFLSDSAEQRTLFRVPDNEPGKTTVGAGEYLVIWCDKDTLQGPNHSNFKLQKEGETLFLSQKLGEELHVLDTVSYPPLKNDMSYGVLSGGDQLVYMMPTPKAPNDPIPARNLLINEFLSKNCGTISDEFGLAGDWIEIFNPGQDTMDLGGLYMTDSLSNPLKHRFPTGNPATKVPPGGHLILWADNQTEKGFLHLDFKLDAKDEEIGIYQLGHGYIDSQVYSIEHGGTVMGRIYDGADQFQPVSPTPGEPNGIRILDNLYINEFMARNNSTTLDPDSVYSDWIEIYNANDFKVDLGGLFITDSLDHPTKYRIPGCAAEQTTIEAGGFLVFWADNLEEKGPMHLGFKLSGQGEGIGLFLEDGYSLVDTMSYKEVEQDMAIGRLEDGAENIQILTASPGMTNYIDRLDNLYISEFSASGNNSHADEAGEFNDWIEIYNDNDFEVNIGGLFITDSLNDLRKYYIPKFHPDSTTIGAKDYLVLWADNQEEQGIRHLDFKLSGTGEQLALVDMDGFTILDSVSYPNQYSNYTYSRLEQTGTWRFLRPTPGLPNINVPIEGITINEIMASNSLIADEYGEFNDWFELYNSNDYPVDLGGLYLTDSLGDPGQYRIPSHSPELTTIDAHGYMVFFADNQKDQGIFHTNFKLSKGGEFLLLIQSDQDKVLDSISYAEQYINSASGYMEEDGKWGCVIPTPGARNQIPDFTGIVINEIMGDNRTVIGDESNEYDDWIELYNTGTSAINVGGMFITDSLADRTKYRIPTNYPDSTTIDAGGYLLLWADKSEEQGIRHLDLKISKTGESVGIYGYREELIDSIYYPFISPNLSYGRTSDGTSDWSIFNVPTPMTSNLYTTGIEGYTRNSDLRIFPNPVNGKANIEISLVEASDLLIEIIDSNGKKCAQFKESHPGNGKQVFQWHVDYSPGLYYCRIMAGSIIMTRKFTVIQH